MNIKNTLFTICFSFLFTAKIFGGIGIEDVLAIGSDSKTTCINAVTMPSTVTTLNEYSTLWGTQTTCSNGTNISGTLRYTISITPKVATTPALPMYARNFSILKSEYIYANGGLSLIDVTSVPHQANFGGIFTLTWSGIDFKIKFLNDPLNKMFNKYNVTVVRCCSGQFVLPVNKVSTYPNPTSGTMNIEYSINEQKNVSILVFDKYNRLVKEVIKNERQEIGNQAIQFDTNDLNDDIYYIRIQTGREVVVKTMLVNRKINY